jgi:hypothetical protein
MSHRSNHVKNYINHMDYSRKGTHHHHGITDFYYQMNQEVELNTEHRRYIVVFLRLYENMIKKPR